MGIVAVAAVAFATSGPLGKMAVAVPASVVASARTGLAAIVLAIFARREVWHAVRGLSARQRVGVAFAGILLAGHFALFLAGLAQTSLAAAVSLISLEPLAVVVASFLAFGLRPTRLELAGLLVATGGAGVVASSAGLGEHRLSGDLLVLGAVVLFGAYVAAARGLRDALPATPYAAAVYAAASLALLPLACLQGVGAPDGRAIAAIVGMAFIPTLIGHTLIQRAARTASPVVVALACPGETVGSLAIGAALMGAAPTPRESLGAALVIAGAVLAIVGSRR